MHLLLPLMIIRRQRAWLSSDVSGVWSGDWSALHLSHRLPSHLSLSPDGARVASSTGIDILLLDDFKLVINDTTHLVRPPRRGENRQRRGRDLYCLLWVISSQLESLPIRGRNGFIANKWMVSKPVFVYLFAFVCVCVLQSCCPMRRQKGWMTSSFWCSSSTPPCASRSTNSAKNASWLGDWRTSTLNSAPWRRSNFLNMFDYSEFFVVG